MYNGQARLYLSVLGRMPTLLHGSEIPNATWGNDNGCPLAVHYWADLQSLRGFRCYNIARTRNVSDCLYSLYAWFLTVAVVLS